MMGYLYILQSEKSGRYYIGSTNDPERRLLQHQNGQVVATKNKGPWRRVALIEFSSPSIAKKAEQHLKRQKTRRAIELVVAGKYIWPDFCE